MPELFHAKIENPLGKTSVPERLLAVVDPKLVNPMVNTTVFPTKALVVFALLPMPTSVPLVPPAREEAGISRVIHSAAAQKSGPIFERKLDFLKFESINPLNSI